MKVAQVVAGTGINGAIRHCYELTCELGEAGHELILIHKPNAWIGQQVFPPGVERIESSLRRNLQELRRISTELKRRNCLAIHTHMSSAHFFGVLLARLFQFKSIATCHMPHFQPHWWWNDRVIAPCNSTRRYQRWINGVPQRRMDVIPNFINPDKFRATLDREAMRSTFDLQERDFAIGVIGTVEPRKGLHVLIKALPFLKHEMIRPIILSVGPIQQPYQQQLLALTEQLGVKDCVRFLDRRNDVANILAALDCVCLPSMREVMPISLMEAMGFGLPVVSTKVGGVPDFIREGVDGFLVPPRDSVSLGEKLVTLAKDASLRREMGNNARRSMQTSFSPTKIIPQIVACYEKTLGPAKRLSA